MFFTDFGFEEIVFATSFADVADDRIEFVEVVGFDELIIEFVALNAQTLGLGFGFGFGRFADGRFRVSSWSALRSANCQSITE
jgi:hypothetical protein